MGFRQNPKIAASATGVAKGAWQVASYIYMYGDKMFGYMCAYMYMYIYMYACICGCKGLGCIYIHPDYRRKPKRTLQRLHWSFFKGPQGAFMLQLGGRVDPKLTSLCKNPMGLVFRGLRV